MEVSVKRLKEIIKEEFDKIAEEEELDIMVKGYGNLGSEPAIALQSAMGNVGNLIKSGKNKVEAGQEAREAINIMLGDSDVDSSMLEKAIEALRPYESDNNAELAIAKLSAVLEQRRMINEEK